MELARRTTGNLHKPDFGGSDSHPPTDDPSAVERVDVAGCPVDGRTCTLTGGHTDRQEDEQTDRGAEYDRIERMDGRKVGGTDW